MCAIIGLRNSNRIMQDNSREKRRLQFFGGLTAFLIFLGVLLWIGPQTIVDHLGKENSYIAIFVLGLVSTVISPIFYATLASFSSADINLLFLALAGGLGLAISDSIFFYLVSIGRDTVSSRVEKYLDKLKNFVQKAPNWLVYTISYIYFGFTPFPNDLLMVSLVAADYSYKQIGPIILLGNLTITFLLVYLGMSVLWA